MKLQTSSQRLEMLPPYLFAELDKKKRALAAKGVDVINLGVGDPDMPPPKRMIEALKEALAVPEYHQYASYNGADFMRGDIAEWLKAYHNVEADPSSEILVLIGSKEGLSHLPQAILNPGDNVVVTDPCYPVHMQAMIFAGATITELPLSEENGFLPDLSRLSEKEWEKTKLLVLNYPNNPTSAVATADFFKQAIDFAHKYNFAICQDSAYIDVCFDGQKQPSLISIDGAKDVAIEFFTFSKMFNICGWRIGFCVGNKDLVGSLGKYKTAIDSGQFTAIQKAVSVGLKECAEDVKKTMAEYKKRRNILCAALKDAGLGFLGSNSTLYVWSKVPKGLSSITFANQLLENTGIVATPGPGFGSKGEGYIRFSFTQPTSRIEEAARRIKNL